MVDVEKFCEGYKCSQGLRGFDHAFMDVWSRLYYPTTKQKTDNLGCAYMRPGVRATELSV